MIPEASEKWYLETSALDRTALPDETSVVLPSDSSANSSSSDGSDIFVRPESNVITIDVDSSVDESVVNVSTQTDLVPSCRCEEAMTAISRLSQSVQTLSNQVDSNFQKLTGQLNLALDAIIRLNRQVLQVTYILPGLLVYVVQ